MDQLITVNERYTTVVNDMQQVARVCLTFGLHVHVGIPDREEAIDIMNQARYFLPHLYALSVNSPFWLGQNTGLKAYRQMIFERLPRTGIPDAFQSLSEYEDYWKLLVATNCIDNPKKIWWDVRLHPFFDTIEFRICDAQSRVDDTIALAALMQAIVFKLQKLRRNNVTFRSYQKRLLDENRWRAGRYGLDGKLIDFGRKCEVDERELLEEMLEFVSDEVEELGNEREIEHIHRIMREGTGADRQLMVWERTQDMKAVVDQIVAETNEGLCRGQILRLSQLAYSDASDASHSESTSCEVYQSVYSVSRQLWECARVLAMRCHAFTVASGTATCSWKVRARIARARMRWGQGNFAGS